jgi:putative membrane protein
MRIDRSLPLKILWGVYAIMWVGGVLRFPDTGWAAPLFLLIAGAIAVLSDIGQWRALLTVAAVGFGFEVLGVWTGFPFGSYTYTSKLQPLILGVPPVIACAWVVLFVFVRQFVSNSWLAAASLTATDLLIDPVACGPLGFWRWGHPGFYFGVPWTNFAGWYLVGAILFRLNPGTSPKNNSQRFLGASILLFFAARLL